MMQQEKPQIQPRKSLLNNRRVSDELNQNNLPKINSKPTLPVKPSVPIKPSTIGTKNVTKCDATVSVSSSNLSTKSDSTNETSVKNGENVQLTSQTKSTINKITLNPSNKKNKLKININDLNKLRLKKNIFDIKNVDNEGKYLLYDVREDEEQINKMNEICELLVASGYFRARIKGLHNFDKVIGGMCWAIQMCNIDLDIDIFYQESLSIGLKIALTEKIVRVLNKMKCPFKLEPHQIQGMDCIHIFPVIQWLVKKSFETRQQNADYIRAYASWQFNQIYNKPSSDFDHNSVILSPKNTITHQIVDPIKSNLQRRFIHPSRDQLQGEQTRIRTTMLEYGVVGSGPSQRVISSVGDELRSNGNNEHRSKDPSKAKDLQLHKSRFDSDSHSVENLLSLMTETSPSGSGDYLKVSTSLVGTIVGEQSDEIKRLSEEYEKNKKSLSSSEAKFLKTETKLKAKLAAKQQDLIKLRENGYEQKLISLKEKIKLVDQKFSELNEIEKTESDEVKAEKMRLTELLTSLRKQKSELKQFCREEKHRLEAQIKQLEIAEKEESKEFNKDKLKELENQASLLDERNQSLKRQLADVSKRYVTMQRKFDDIPTRAELAQYQKRFLELYNQLSNKHNETKKFYTLYNTLSDERMYLEKEFNLINSILENFQKAYLSTTAVKEDFLAKFEQTVESIVQNKNKVEQRSKNESTKRVQLESEYMELVEQQRLYVTAVKQFKEECKRNEQLIIQLER